MQQKRQNPKAKQVKGTNYVRAIYCCLCNPPLLLGSLLPSNTNRTGQPCTHQMCPQQCEEDTGLGGLGLGVCDPPQQRYLGSGNRFTPNINTNLRASFSATVVGLPACREARVPVGQVGMLLGSAGGFSGNL